jgi:hypothetical protein
VDNIHAIQNRLSLINNTLRPLTEAEREEAYDVARHRVAGKPVEQREYPPLKLPEQEPAEYPDWMIYLVVTLCIVVLIGAFIPSAYRMYVAGETVFCDAFAEFTDPDLEDEITPEPPAELCVSVGVMTVIMAEIGQTVALLAIAVLGTTSSSAIAVKKATSISNAIFWGVAVMTTIVAYTGNLHVARPWTSVGPFFGVDIFAWILDLFPPTLVIGIMYALKELMLYFIKRRYQYITQISDAKTAREDQIDADRTERKYFLDKPEEHPQWLRVYSLAIREAMSLANGRQKGERSTIKDVASRHELLLSLSNDEWKYLIKTQMQAGDFTVDPGQVTAVEKFQQRIEEIQKEEPLADIAPKQLTFDEEVLDTVKADVWEDSPGVWAFKSKISGYVRKGIGSQSAAEKALKQYEYHYNRRNS